MTTLRACVALMATSTLCLIGSWLPAAEWRMVTLDGGRYQVEMPGSPVIVPNKQDSKIYGLIRADYYLAARADKIPTVIERTTEWKTLEAAGKGAESGAKAKRLKEERIQWSGSPGLELLLEFPNGEGYLHWRGYLIDNHLVQVVAVTKSRIPPDDVARFLDSLQRAPSGR